MLGPDQSINQSINQFINVNTWDGVAPIIRARGSCVKRIVQKVDNTIQRINLYLVENTIGFLDTYPLDSDLSGG